MEKEKLNARELAREYRSELLANIKAAEVIDLVTFKQLLETLDIKYLGKKRDNKNFPSMTLFNLKKEGLVEIVKDGKDALISIIKEDTESKISREEAKEVVKSVVPQKSEKKPTDKKPEKKVKVVGERSNVPLEERLRYVIQDERVEFTYPQLTEVMKFNFRLTSQYLKYLNKYCDKNYKQAFGTIDFGKKIFIKNTGLVLDKKADKEKEIKTEQPEKVVKSEVVEKKIIPEVDFETAYIRFAVAGILKSLDSTVIVGKLSDQLRDYFEINVDPRLLILNLKEEHEFTLIDGGKKIGLRSDKSWGILKEKYNPRQYTIKLLARISMTKEEVESYFENAEVKVVSVIKYADNIYELTIDRSVHTRRQLLRLYKSFRATDKILEEEIDNILQKYVKDEENRAYRFYCPFEIENI